MRIWGWKIERDTEERGRSYTQDFINRRLSDYRAGPGSSGTVEAAVSLWERGFCMMRATNAPEGLDTAFFAATGRDLAEKGSATWLLTRGGLRRCTQAHKMRRGWQLQVSARSQDDPTETRYALPQEVLHVCINTDPLRPWEGRPPSLLAKDTLALDQALDLSAAAILRNPGYGSQMIVAPVDRVSDSTRAALESRLTQEKPEVRVADGGEDGRLWHSIPLTPDVDRGTVPELIPHTVDRIAAAFGIPPMMFSRTVGASTLRESMRMFAFTVLNPMARLLEREIRLRIAPECILDVMDYLAADAAGAARAYKTLTEAGVTPEDAWKYLGYRAGPNREQDGNT